MRPETRTGTGSEPESLRQKLDLDWIFGLRQGWGLDLGMT